MTTVLTNIQNLKHGLLLKHTRLHTKLMVVTGKVFIREQIFKPNRECGTPITPAVPEELLLLLSRRSQSLASQDRIKYLILTGGTMFKATASLSKSVAFE